MPSLRRSASVPSVTRSSPYPMGSSVASGGPNARAGGHGPRRSTGSETSGRRVLADIEWWKVQAAQNPESEDVEEQGRDEELVTLDLALVARLPLVPMGVERPSTPDNQTLSGITAPEETVAAPFAALSIGPDSPAHRRGHNQESSWSSLESTPEASETPLEISRLESSSPTPGATDIVMQDLATLPNLRRGRAAPRAIRSYSLGHIMPSNSIGNYADLAVSPLSPTRSTGLSY